MKRLLTLLLALVLMISVPAMAAETAEIEFFCVKTEVIDVMNEIIAAFEAENPGIKVTLTYAADGETVLQTRVSTNDVPDVMSLYPAEPVYKGFYDGGYVMDLTGQEFLNNVEESMLKISDYNGIQFSLPYTLSTYGIFYNKKIFADLNLTVPTTIDEFIATCKTLKEAGYDAVALPMSDGQNQIVERFISAMDAEAYKQFEQVAAGEITVRDMPVLKAFADFMLAIQPYCTEDAMGLSNDSAAADFANGVAAMRFQGAWFLSTALEANPDLDIGMFPIPSPIMEKNKVPVNIDSAFSIAKDTQYPEACLKFVDFLSRKEIAHKFYEVDGNINMIKGVEYDKQQMMDLYNEVMAGNMSLTQINLWGPTPTSVRRGLGAAFQLLMMDGDIDAYYDMCEEAIVDNY